MTSSNTTAFAKSNDRRRFLIILLVFCGSIILPPVGHATQEPAEVNLRVRGVGLGSSQAAVLRRFGKPLSRKREKVTEETCGPAHSDLTLRYEGIVFSFEGDLRGRRFEVVSVEVTSPKLIITPAMKIGLTEKQVRARLGSPWETRDESGLHKLVYTTRGNDGGAVLSFEQGKLVNVYWQYTLC